MASVQNNPTDSTEKIVCKSYRSLQTITNHLDNEITTLLKDNGNSDEDNDFLKSKIMQIYKKVLAANITCDGQAVNFEDNELNTTSECEPFDTAKEHYISHTLMNQLEQQMTSTARLRKTGAAQVHSKLKKLIRPQLKHLYTVEVQPEDGAGVAMETDEVEGDSSLQERLQGTGLQQGTMEQVCTDMLQKAKDLAKATHMYHKTEDSEFQRALCETPPTTPDIANQNCIQAARLDKNLNKKLPI